jgi:hypothetical protein
VLTHGAEKARGAAAVTLAPVPHLALDADKKGNRTDRRYPEDDGHVGRIQRSRKDMLLFDSAQALLIDIVDLVQG